MSLIGTFTNPVKLGTLRGEAETGFIPGNPDDLVAVDRIPSVSEATATVLKARERLAAATSAAAQFPAGKISLGAAVATENLESAHEAVRAAEEKLREVRESERDRIIAARLPRERELRRELLATLEVAAERARGLHRYKTETQELVGGQRAFEGAGNFDWAGEFCDESTRESVLTIWRRGCEREGLL